MAKFLLLVLFLLVGCSSQPRLAPNEHRLTIRSEPSGAKIYHRDVFVGMTPFEAKYGIDNQDIGKDTVVIPLKLVWASGNQSVHTITIWPKKNKVWYVNLSRPYGMPGLDVDLSFAADQQLREAEARDRADREAAAKIEAIGNMLNSAVQGYNAGRYGIK